MNATTAEMIRQIVEVCLIPLLGILTTYLVKYIKVKSEQLTTTTDNQLASKYLNLLSDTVTKCVIATNQTYVETLKQQNAFTAEAQKEAFDKTLFAVTEILSADAKKYLTETFGDLNAYITTQIEATVNQNKITVEK